MSQREVTMGLRCGVTRSSFPCARLLICGLPLALALGPGHALAHGFAGKRFFPATLAVDDPFVTDEAGVLYSNRKTPNGDGTNTGTGDLAVDYAKSITSRFALSVSGDYLQLKPDGAAARSGFANSAVGAKYLAYVNEEGESLLSVGAAVEIGGSGTPRVGASAGSTVSPTLYFGKGFGGLPDSLKYLRPLAVIGALAPNLSASHWAAQSATTGLTLQYNIAYLQSFVQDFGWGAPLDRMVFVVEFPVQTCTTGACSGQATGTANPGVIWVGRYFQLGFEATLPLNGASGSHAGFMAQLHFFVDDIDPQGLGRPLVR
jgi:hypothetical protein